MSLLCIDNPIMYSSMWFMSIVALLVVDVRTGAMQQQDIQPRRCYQCAPTNSTACDQAGGWSTVVCPNVLQFCATLATAPDFISSLACAPATQIPCSLKHTSKHALKLTCVCNGHRCNVPFSQKLRNALLNYTKFNTSDDTNLNESFFIYSKFANISEASLYKAITIELNEATEKPMNFSELTTLAYVPAANSMNTFRHLDKMIPQPEALKQEATIPSEDDEDESEGSGSEEEPRSRIPPASAPAAPSSYLPANENKACNKRDIFKHVLLAPLFVYIVI